MKRNLVYVVGLGPGDPQFLTAQAKTALENADVLCGYTAVSYTHLQHGPFAEGHFKHAFQRGE